MTAKEITELISLCVSLLIPIAGFIGALVKIIKDKRWNILKSKLIEFMEKAEEMIDATGAEKKQAVLNWCEDFCRKQGINFDANQVSDAIEKLIDLTKKVNNHSNSQTSAPAETTSSQTA